ncbi:non-histone chromosomal protein HMG-14-like [Mesocricetus auratus]|uniref:Non-histone chromosomal protein HMG-14-like n=1 Tax=Mesocricetus auratus TaxID=10036 RepID=A0ABM2WY00_MESAU|nr:non-histone chromosomal protein HMG-14-like [Mesocricetus auratus]
MPKRKVSTGRATKAKPKNNSVRLLARPAGAKVDMKPKKAARRDKSSDIKVQTKGKGWSGWPAKYRHIDLPIENGETEN